MKRVAIILGLLFLTKSLHAELRGIVLEITTPSHKEATTGYTVYAPAEVSIYSDEEVERKQKVSAAQAADVLKHASGWKSAVMVIIVFHNTVRPEDLIGILEGMNGNSDLMLGYVGSADYGPGKQDLDKVRH